MKNMKDSPSIPQRVLVEQESGSEVLVSTPSWLALAKRAGKYEIPLSVIEQVYARGYIESTPHPKNTPEQQAFHRVDSFIHEGKAYELDNDLTEMCPVPDGSKHMDVIKNAIKNHKERIKSQQVNEGFATYARYGAPGLAAGALVGAAKGVGGIIRAATTGHFTKKGLYGSAKYQAKQKFKKQESDYLAKKMFAQKYPGAEQEASTKKTSTEKAPTKTLAPRPYRPKPKPPPYIPGSWAEKHPPPKGWEHKSEYSHVTGSLYNAEKKKRNKG